MYSNKKERCKVCGKITNTENAAPLSFLQGNEFWCNCKK